MGVNVSEYVMSLNPNIHLTRAELIEALLEAVKDIPSVEVEVEQPIAHLISHMLSGVTAQIAIKIMGDDLEVLRRSAEEIKQAIGDIPGLAPPLVEQQQRIPQLRIELGPFAAFRLRPLGRLRQPYDRDGAERPDRVTDSRGPAALRPGDPFFREGPR